MCDRHFHAGVKPLRDKKAKTVLHGFLKIVFNFYHKQNKLWVDNKAPKFKLVKSGLVSKNTKNC